MSLKERAGYYYHTLDKGCAEAILLAANEVYGLGLTEADTGLFAGFRTGMGCGSTCGSLTGAIGVLGRKYGQREDLKELCARFVEAFEQKMACGATDCATLAARYKTEASRCRAAVELTAEALEEFIDKLEGRTAAPTD
jgi:C_GCAxxG_C_C family probable redox protein